MNWRQLPNIITTLRLLSVPPLVWLILHEAYPAALLLALAAGFSDLMDGYLAKRNNWVSRYGSIADPLADKLLMLASFASLAWQELLPWWLLYLTLFRDLVIVSGATAYHFLVEPLTATPTLLGKLNTTLQILLVTAVLIDAGYSPLPPWLLLSLILAVTVVTTITLLQYVIIWSIRTRERWPQ
ncbi:MAG: CDP-alcohol phosphatidyltransferase family protein [Wenzhouxiangellaceae bacterium]